MRRLRVGKLVELLKIYLKYIYALRIMFVKLNFPSAKLLTWENLIFVRKTLKKRLVFQTQTKSRCNTLHVLYTIFETFISWRKS